MTNGDSNLYERMRGLSVSSKRAKLFADFIVVGGGLGGLACAYALASGGHRVQILEKSAGPHQYAGGIRIPPNLTKILLEWDLSKEVLDAMQCRKTQFFSLDTGDIVGQLEWQEDIIQEAGADFLLMHHDDLYQALYKLAVKAGASISFDSEVKQVYFDDANRQAIAVLANGAERNADIIVGADGYHSIVRTTVAPDMDDGIDTKHSFYTITVPTSKMQDDPVLRKLAGLSEWEIWMGNSRSVLGYPIRDGTEYSLHVYWPDEELREPIPKEGWDVLVPTSVIDFEGYDSSVAKLFNLASEAIRTKFIKHEVLEEWVDDSGRIVLIGEAAHPLLPCNMHGPSLAIEDAAVLGTLMSHLSMQEQIPQLLDAFQDLRRDRCVQVNTSELRNAMLVTLPPGEQRDMRDSSMNLSLQAKQEVKDDTALREQWEEIGDVFGYNAREAAEDWWVKWGVLGCGAHEYPIHEPMDLIYKVTKIAVNEM